MEFNTRVAHVAEVKTDCVAVGVFADGGLTAAAEQIDRASKGAVRHAINSGDASGKRGTTLLLRNLTGVKSPRVLLVGLGKASEFNDKAFADAVRSAVKGAGAGAKEVALAAADWRSGDSKAASKTVSKIRDHAWQARTAAITARAAVFRVDELKSKKDDGKSSGPRSVVFLTSQRDAGAERGAQEGVAIANGMELTKRLGNLPGNVCTPIYLAEQAKQLAKQFKLDVEVFDEKKIQQLKMGSFWSVAKGSAQPPRFIVLKYNGGKKGAAPHVLVGKGITFDSGGISIKPSANMDEMKYDMCGAGSVLGTLRAVAELKLKLNVIGVIPTCENMPSGTANKPGDIVTSMSGQTIEVLNTDAEGRLILCDALTYVERFKPAAVVDVATLTGACIIALGNINSGLFTQDEKLAADLLTAAKTMNDPVWRLPLDDEYQEQLKSNFADMANIGTPSNAGAVTAACFLSRFTKAYPWAHIDIAGTAWKTGGAKGATGRPVPLLVQFLMSRV